MAVHTRGRSHLGRLLAAYRCPPIDPWRCPDRNLPGHTAQAGRKEKKKEKKSLRAEISFFFPPRFWPNRVALTIFPCVVRRRKDLGIKRCKACVSGAKVTCVCLFSFLPSFLLSYKERKWRGGWQRGGGRTLAFARREKNRKQTPEKKKGRGKKKKSITRNSTLDRENPDQNII